MSPRVTLASWMAQIIACPARFPLESGSTMWWPSEVVMLAPRPHRTRTPSRSGRGRTGDRQWRNTDFGEADITIALTNGAVGALTVSLAGPSPRERRNVS